MSARRRRLGGAVSPVEPQQEEPKPEEPKQEEPKVEDIQDEDTRVETAQKCLCEDAAKCTKETVNEECPVCAEKDAELEKVCKGTPNTEDTGKGEEKNNAESENMAKGVNDAEDGDKTEDENTEKEADEKAAENNVPEENADKLLLDGNENNLTVQAENTQTATLSISVKVRKKDMTVVSADNGSVTLTKADDAQENAQPLDSTTGKAQFENLALGTYQASAKVTVNGIERTARTTVEIIQENLGQTVELELTVLEPKVTVSVTAEGKMSICDSSELSFDGIEELEKELEQIEDSDAVFSIKVTVSAGGLGTVTDISYNSDIQVSYHKIVDGKECDVTDAERDKFINVGIWLIVPMRTNGYKFVMVVQDAGHEVPQGEIVRDTNASYFKKEERSTGIRLIKSADHVRLQILREGTNAAVSIRFNGNGDGAQVGEDSFPAATFEQDGQTYCSLPDSRINASRPGYVFQGWATTANATQSDVSNKYSLIPVDAGKQEVTLYAVWTPITYKVTFDANGGTLEGSSEPIAAQYNVLITQPTANRAGYRLLGWATDANATEPIAEANLKNLATEQDATVTLYAVWQCLYKMDSNSLITFNLAENDGLMEWIKKNMDFLEIRSRATDAESLLKQLANKGKLNLEDLNFGDNKRYAMAFDVSLYENGSDKITELGKDHALTLNINIDPKIDWAVGNVSGYNLHEDDFYDLDLCLVNPEAPAPYREFKAKTIQHFSPFVIYVTPYVITFDSQGGSAVSDMKAGTDGKLAAMPVNPTKTGYTFDGWYLNKDGTGTKVDETYQFSGDTTVYAKWIPNSYTVTFHANYGSTDTTATQYFKYDQLQALNCGSTIQRDYYKITGWAETKDGEKKYDVNETVKNLSAESNGNKDLYALWEYVPYTVTFNANGVDNNNNPTKGTVTEDGTDKDKVERKTQETPINTLKTLPVPNAQDGYYFEGWYYQDKNDKNKEKLVKVGDTVFTEDTEVYAKWTVFEPVTVTLKCQRGNMTINGKTVTTTTMETKWPGVIDGTLPTAARSGYKFDGWYTAAGVKVTEDTVFLRDTTIYARFTSAVSRTGNPKTGDQAMLGAAVAVLVVAAVGLGAAVVINKKKK